MIKIYYLVSNNIIKRNKIFNIIRLRKCNKNKINIYKNKIKGK